MGIGEQVLVSAVGGMSAQGVFWVRVLPDETGLQDVMLQNIATTIGLVNDLTQHIVDLKRVH